ncbi:MULTISPECIES: hypothetical protein [unclassified Amycolatopsis]|uniref:hypothetical protein n=1 Tax=unclassified Amycolatopsis TaxID=2618356 RepID=UPI00136B1391|nr:MULTISPECIES: hypothetical protein [unclassified Amycolatopsis]MDS0135754.1 hypothetical protein [Amycolatopsis sp. 505]MDS0145645.1 hypothetical protein [Amycolatopsis sp. CM201R]NBH10905.1 hypothetical protein [Amycolatopsis sp. SID8362]NED47597.1 hypothetical protein [Amycolatopsis sp. SID8362]
MNGLTVTPTQILAGVGVLIVLLWVWRAGARRAKAAAEAARSGARLVSLVGRVLFNAGLIVAVQWVVIAHPGSPWLLFAVLGLPALFASYALTRAMTVTTVDTSKRGGRR